MGHSKLEIEKKVKAQHARFIKRTLELRKLKSKVSEIELMKRDFERQKESKRLEKEDEERRKSEKHHRDRDTKRRRRETQRHRQKDMKIGRGQYTSPDIGEVAAEGEEKESKKEEGENQAEGEVAEFKFECANEEIINVSGVYY